MKTKIGINGLGRIGRMVVRSIFEEDHSNLKIQHINNRADIETACALLKRDSIHGKFNADISIEKSFININGNKIYYSQIDKLEEINWKDNDVDFVLECTGKFNSKEKLIPHLSNGAKKVIVSAPCKNADKTIVFGVNEKELKKEDKIISAASCTTNCLAPLAKVIHEEYKILNGMANTIHAYTNDQSLLDVHHSDLLRARAASLSMIPTKTGAATAVGDVLPELKGKLDGLAVRVPVSNVSLLDFTFTTQKDFSIDELNTRLLAASKNGLSGILDVNEVPLVSTDFGNDPHSVIYDKSHTRKIDNSTKILAWYDNEWGFSNRMLDVANYLNQLSKKESQAA